jgi:ATP-binding cassette subfamily F protein 3
VVKRVVEVEDASLYEYPGNYTKYVELRRQRKLTEQRTYEKQLDRIRQEEGYIARYKAGQRAKQARGRESRLQRFKQRELLERPRELDVMHLNLPKARRSGDLVINAEGISKRYGDLVLFENLSMSVQRGERIGIIGPNGVGKTTLVSCLVGELEPDNGHVRTGSRLSRGYYRQIPLGLDESLAIWQYLQQVIVSLDGQVRAGEQQARDLAGAFLFSGAEQDKPLSALSGGERARVVLAGLVAGAHNLLVLDEPTNHLDIPSAERLEQALGHEGGWDGTLLLVSHDRALLDATCSTLLVFDGHGDVRLFHGRYSQWAEKAAKAEAARTARRRAEATRPKRTTPVKPSRPSARKQALSLSKIETRIEQIETRLGEIDTLLIQPDVYTDGNRCRDLQAERSTLQDELEPLETEWSRRAADAE